VAAIGRKGDGIYSESNKWKDGKDNSFYAISKNKAENEVWRGIQEGLEAVIINPGIILGPSTWNRSSTTIFKKIYSGLSHYPTGSNGFVDVRDVSKSILELMNSKISAERYIVVGENLSYENVLKTIAKSLNVNPPLKIASKKLMNLAWKLEFIKCFITRKNPQLTKETARTSSQNNHYNNQKIINQLDFKFNSIEDAIENTSKYLLKFK
jgi:nucleoside-diphosphate-sugar epimerase